MCSEELRRLEWWYTLKVFVCLCARVCSVRQVSSIRSRWPTRKVLWSSKTKRWLFLSLCVPSLCATQEWYDNERINERWWRFLSSSCKHSNAKFPDDRVKANWSPLRHENFRTPLRVELKSFSRVWDRAWFENICSLTCGVWPLRVILFARMSSSALVHTEVVTAVKTFSSILRKHVTRCSTLPLKFRAVVNAVELYCLGYCCWTQEVLLLRYHRISRKLLSRCSPLPLKLREVVIAVELRTYITVIISSNFAETCQLFLHVAITVALLIVAISLNLTKTQSLHHVAVTVALLAILLLVQSPVWPGMLLYIFVRHSNKFFE